MSHDQASIIIAGRSIQLPLDHLHFILCNSDAPACTAQFKRAQLLRLTRLALRRAFPDRRREFFPGSGPYWLGIGREHWECRTLSDILASGMRWLYEHDQNALLCLSRQRKISRAYIATDPVALYGGRGEYAGFAKPFAPGWYVDTNLSLAGTHRFLNDAFMLAKLKRGQDWYFDRLR